MVKYPVFQGQAVDAYNKMVNIMVNKLKTEQGLPDDQIVVRDMRPEDIMGNANTYYPAIGGQAGTFTDLVSGGATVANNRFVGIYGVYSNATDGAFNQLRITRKGSTSRFYETNSIRLWQHRTAWFTDPITVDQNTNITVAFSQRTNLGSMADYALIGLVVEKRGLLVSPLC